jgi:hypothetical protein
MGLLIVRLEDYTPSDGAEERLMFALGLFVYMGLHAPAVVLHGLYDAACIHDEPTAWIVGGASLAICLLLLITVLYISRRADREDSKLGLM